MSNLFKLEEVSYAVIKQVLKEEFKVALMIIKEKIVNVVLTIERLNKINIKHFQIIIRALNFLKMLKESNEVNKILIIIF